MADPPAPYVPRRSDAPKSRIRPAGWVVIVLAAGLLGYLAWDQWGAALLGAGGGQPPAPASTDTTPPEAARPDADHAERSRAGIVLSPTLFPQGAPSLPPPSPGALANVVLPPLDALATPPAGARAAPSELEALRMVARGEAEATIVSVAALAAAPEAVDAGVRASWFVGLSPGDGALFPSCDGGALAKLKLGAVPGSLGEFHLLAALAGRPLPEFVTFEREADLARAIDERTVTGGPARGRARRTASPPCPALPPDADALVVVRDTRHPMSPEALAALVAVARVPAPSPGEVAGFFDPHRKAPGGFASVFTAASDVWSAVGLIGRPAKAKFAVDPTFVEPGTQLLAPEPPAASAEAAPRHELGFPSSIDR